MIDSITIIRELVYIEERARGVTHKSNAMAEEYARNTESDTKDIRAAARDECLRRLSGMREEGGERLQLTLKEEEERLNMDLMRLRENFAVSQDSLKKGIYYRIISAGFFDGREAQDNGRI